MKAVLSLLAAAALVASVCAMPTYEEWAEMNEAENLRQDHYAAESVHFRMRDVAAQVLRANSVNMAEAMLSLDDVNAVSNAMCAVYKNAYLRTCHTFTYANNAECQQLKDHIQHTNRCGPNFKLTV